MIFRTFLLKAMAALLWLASIVNARTDPATGIAFPDSRHGLSLFGVGVRRKGPIKVYSVAMYGSAALYDKLAGCSKNDALQVLQNGVQGNEETSFSLQLNMNIGAEKLASAIADSVSPRLVNNNNNKHQDVDKLKALILQGIPATGAVKGTTMEFDCTSNALQVSINGKSQGSVTSVTLPRAFCNVFVDDKCASPAMRQDCLNHIGCVE